MSIREELNDRDIQHRKDFADYVTHHAASDWHREVLDPLYQHWVSVNRDHFEGTCVEPYITLGDPGSPRLLGVYLPVGEFGSQAQIIIRPMLIDGEHKRLRPGDEYAEGRMRFVKDVLLHESVHQYCHEKLKDPEKSYKGHGPIFTGQCNRIGATLGLPPVRLAKKGRKDEHLPTCADWPHNVRPADYYLGAVVEEQPRPKPDDDGEDDTPQTFPCPFDPKEAGPVLRANFDQAGRQELVFELLPVADFNAATVKAIMNAISPPKPEAEAKEEPPARPKRSRRIPANGDTKRTGDARPKRGKTVSASSDKAKRKPGKPVSANGDKSPPERRKDVSAGGDKATPVLKKGDRVRSKRQGTTPRGMTGTIIDTIDSRLAKSRPGMDYRIKWEDGTTEWERIGTGTAGTIEAIE
jgi:hypothetical protein